MNVCVFGASPEKLTRIKECLVNDNVFEPKHMCGKQIDVIITCDDKPIEVEYIDDALKRYASSDFERYAQEVDLYKIAYEQVTARIPKLLTYEEFLEQNKVHKTYKCYVRGCNNIGEYDCYTLDGGECIQFVKSTVTCGINIVCMYKIITGILLPPIL